MECVTEMKTLTLKAPAKINLNLYLTGKRDDGFNNLCSVFQKIDLADELRLQKIPRGFKMDIDGEKPCATKDNIVYKAYRLVKQKTRFVGGVHVTLKKIVPAAAGLGGASSDAAFFLRGINTLYDLQLDDEMLLEFARELGSDVPFFIYPFSSALGIGRGDLMMDLRLKKKYWILLAVQDAPLSTKRVYEAFQYPESFQINLTKLSRKVIILTQNYRRGDILSLGKDLKNDLSPVACSLMPSINEVIRYLKRNGYPATAMSGSGPTVFSLFARKKDSISALRKLLSYSHRIKAVVCQSLV